MLAVIAREIGPADQVVDCVSQAEPPAPAQGEVLLEMLAMSINPADLLMIEGRYGVAAEPPFTPGFEGIGRVLACGDGVDDIAPGDLVLPGGGGCWRERLVRRRDALVKLPPDVDPIQAAMLRANPATAWAMLESIPGLEPGEWVAQNAANSAVGGYVHQLARRRGVHVLAIVRREAAAAAARASGAHAVLVDDGSLSLADLARQAAALTGGRSLRGGFDAIGGDATGRLARCLGPGATVLNYGLLAGEACRIEPHDLVFRDIRLHGFWLPVWFRQAGAGRAQALYDELVALLRTGVLAGAIERRYRLTEARSALRHAAQAGRGGKILFITDALASARQAS